MNKTHLPFHDSAKQSTAGANASHIPVPELKQCIEMWLMDCEIRQHSNATLENRRFISEKMLWYFDREKIDVCNKMALSRLMLYIKNGHAEPGGRWGNPRLIKPVTPGTSATYHRHMRALFNWIVADGSMAVSPMESVSAPIDRPDDIQPFTDAEVAALFAAARKTAQPKRDEAILYFLLDSGARVSEICSLRRGDMDAKTRSANVEGKGGKKRNVYVSPTTYRIVWQYMQQDEYEADDPLFQSRRGTRAGDGMTRNGILQLVHRVAKIAGITRKRCCPHTFRHTFAVMYLRPKNGKPGGQQTTLMRILGHTNVKMTSRYVQLAQADVATEHRMNSPVEQVRRRK